MVNQITDTAALLNRLSNFRPICKCSKSLSLSEHLIRATDGTALAGVGGEVKKGDAKERINLLADALIWLRHSFPEETPLHFVLGNNARNMKPVLNSLATLCQALAQRQTVTVQVDCEVVQLPFPNFAKEEDPWTKHLLRRSQLQPPDLAIQLANEVGRESFCWYHTLKGSHWSGRVEGLEVCRLHQDGQKVTLKIGKPGSKGDTSKARSRFIELLGETEFHFSPSSVASTARRIQVLAIDREKGPLATVDREHHLESRVLRGAIPVRTMDSLQLVPVVQYYPFQFPTRWYPRGKPKFLDVLMRSGDTPWALELKVSEEHNVRYYRQAIPQVVLYREFLRHTESFFPWFEEHGLEATKCRAAIAFPKRLPKAKSPGFEDIRWLADMFDVEVIELDGS